MPRKRAKKKVSAKVLKRKIKTSELGNSPQDVLGKILPIILPFIFFGVFFAFLSKGAFHFLTHSPYFSIKTVEAASTYPNFTFKDETLMGSLLGDNIFAIELKRLEKDIIRKHPELAACSVRRTFPNHIQIEIDPRRPVARIHDWKAFLIDKEGILLPESEAFSEEMLPLIVGFRAPIEHRQIGHTLRSKALSPTLAFLEGLEKLPELKRFVHIVDVSDIENLSFRTPEGLEVRVGNEDFQEKLERFDRTRVTLGNRIEEVKYIDLRFDEVVIGSR